MTDARPASAALGAALVTLVTVESLRVFLPATLLVLPATTVLPFTGALLLVAGVLVLLPLLVAPVAGSRPRQLWLGAGGLLAVARGALLLDPAGTLLLVLAGIGTASGLVTLLALAAGARSARPARVGILIGLAVEALLRTAFATLGPLWSQTPVAALTTVGLLVVLVAGIGRGADDLSVGRAGGPAAWPWWWLLPALTLAGVVTTAPGRIAVATGWTPGQVAVAAATTQVAAVLAALLAPRLTPRSTAILGAGLTLVGTTAALPAAGWPGVLGPIATATGLGALAGTETSSATPTGTRQRGLVAGAAIASAHGLLLLYYLGPRLGVPVHTRLLLLIAAGTALPLALATLRAVRRVPTHLRLQPVAALRSVLAGAATVALVAGVATTTTSMTQPPPDDSDELVVATYQLAAGFGSDGRYDPRRQAAVLRDHAVDVVVVTGVDRGWWSTGGQDLLPLFAAELGLDHVRFVRAADEVHGHALLSRFPVAEFGVESLPGGRGPSTHSLLAAVLELDDGSPLGVVGTELASTPRTEAWQLPQARAVAGTVARLRERAVPTVLLGDLGAPAGSATLESFEPLLDSALPEGARSFPSPAPVELRSHVLLSPDLRRSTVAIPTSDASTHLPVVVTVERQVTAD